MTVTEPSVPNGLVHWVGEANNTLHGNGAAVMGRTSGDEDEVTCPLCQTLLSRQRREMAEDEQTPRPDRARESEPTADVDLLIRASTLMARRAGVATPGPWAAERCVSVDESGSYDLFAVTARMMPTGDDTVAAVTAEVLLGDAEHIAGWHPLVADVVAASLARVAYLLECGSVSPSERSCAVAIARAYLGETHAPTNPAPVEAVEAAAVREPMRYVDATTHEPCPTRDNLLCTITDPTHRHLAAHMINRPDPPTAT